MQWIMGLNAVGVLAGAGYFGMVFTQAHTPFWGGLAVLVFFIGLFQPLVVEHLLIDSGFREVEGGFLSARRRERGMGPDVEIIAKAPPSSAFHGRRRKGRVALALFVVGCLMTAYDAYQWTTTRVPEPAPGIISNF